MEPFFMFFFYSRIPALKPVLVFAIANPEIRK